MVVLLQYTLTCMVISGYITGILCTLIFDFSIVKCYFLGTSFIYYLIALIKSPGSLFDINDSEVKGICNKCNRIRGNHTKHCSICNKCYYKRDHHCVFLGKCIASNNLKDFLFSLIFLTIYGVLRLFTSSLKLVTAFFTFVALCATMWFSCVLTSEKTSGELAEFDKWRISRKDLRKFLLKMKDSPVNILFPYLKFTNTVEY